MYCSMNNLSLKGTEIPIFFHNLKGYDMNHNSKELEKKKVEVSGTSQEKFITAKVHLLEDDDGSKEIDGKKTCHSSKLNYGLEDSFAFMISSLAALASNLEKEDLISIFDFVKNYFIRKRYPTHQCYPEPPVNELERQVQIQRIRKERRRNHRPIPADRNGVCYLYPSNIDDFKHWRMVQDPEYIDPTTQEKIKTGLELLTRKGVYLYAWMDDEDKLYTTSLPDKECFHGELYNDSI